MADRCTWCGRSDTHHHGLATFDSREALTLEKDKSEARSFYGGGDSASQETNIRENAFADGANYARKQILADYINRCRSFHGHGLPSMYALAAWHTIEALRNIVKL